MNNDIYVVDIDDEVKFDIDDQIKETTDLNSFLDDVEKVVKNKEFNQEENFMKKDSIERKKLLQEANDEIDIHSKKLIEYNNKVNEYNNLKTKYTSLVKRFKEVKEVIKLSKEKDIYTEIIKFRKEKSSLENKNNMLKSLLQSIIEEKGIEDICSITRITEEKIKEYLKN